MIWLVRLCMLPTPTPDDAGDSSFLGPSRDPNQRLTWGRARARAPEAAETAAQKNSPQASPETQKQQNTVNSSILWPGSRARARQKKARTAQRASQPQQKQNGQNNSPPLSTAVFDGIYSVL